MTGIVVLLVLALGAALALSASQRGLWRDQSRPRPAGAESRSASTTVRRVERQADPIHVEPAHEACREHWETGPVPRLGVTPFAIVDVETTGFNPVPDGRHRIVEVAVVRMLPDGRIEDEYVTLVNPQGRMGATHIHGIRASDVAGAPTFAEIAGDVGTRLADAIVVAHNIPFDLKFLVGEYAQAGIVLPEIPRVCTLQLAYRFAEVPCRKLGFLCEEFGIPIDAHSALGDARAVGQLLRHFLDAAERAGRFTRAGLGMIEVPVLAKAWCGSPPSGRSTVRPRSDGDAPAVLETVVAKRWSRDSVPMAEQQYFDALELALGDDELNASESRALGALAAELGVRMDDLNRRYVLSVAEGAKSDGVVTPEEAAEVHRVAMLVGVSRSDAESMLVVSSAAPTKTVVVAPGTAVCLVGDFEVMTRGKMLELASRRNFVVRKNITTSVGVVVVQSRAAEVRRQGRARALGIPVMTAEEFLTLAASNVAA